MSALPPKKYLNWMDPHGAAEIHSTAVIQAASEVHRLLGPGYGEQVYAEALCDEMAMCGVPFTRNPVLAVHYKGRFVGEQKLDLLIGQDVLVDLMACDALNNLHSAKMMSYLKATKLIMGLLINFNVHQMIYGIKRIQVA